MYQVQSQLALYELEWVDFVVWTKKGCNVQRMQIFLPAASKKANHLIASSYTE